MTWCARGVLYGEPIGGKQLEYVMAFKSRVGSVNRYPKGSTVGYDRTFTLKRDSRLANLPFGYSDGYRRAFTNKGHVLIRGHKVPVVGKISMNTTMVDVTDFPDIQANDEVVILANKARRKSSNRKLKRLPMCCLPIFTPYGQFQPENFEEIRECIKAA